MSHNQYQQSYTERLDNGANTAINGNELSENLHALNLDQPQSLSAQQQQQHSSKKKSRRPVRAFHTEFNSPIPTTSSTPAFPSSPIVAGYPQNYASVYGSPVVNSTGQFQQSPLVSQAQDHHHLQFATASNSTELDQTVLQDSRNFH